MHFICVSDVDDKSKIIRLCVVRPSVVSYAFLGTEVLIFQQK